MSWKDVTWAVLQVFSIGLLAFIIWHGLPLLVIHFPSDDIRLFKLCFLVFAFLGIVMFTDIGAGTGDKLSMPKESDISSDQSDPIS